MKFLSDVHSTHHWLAGSLIRSLDRFGRAGLVGLAAAAAMAAPGWAQCVPGGGDHTCCTTGTPGCSDEACCSAVCGVDSFCCAVAWDGVCVDEADVLCVGGCGPSCGNSDHDCCTVGSAACSDASCCTTVCSFDPFCCNVEWDSTCVDAAVSLCGGCGPVDTDGDGISDADESAGCTNPNNPDTDGDGLGDGEEATYGTDPCNFDTDGDSLSDGAEVEAAAGGGCPSPTDADSDDDGISDGAEVTTLPSATDPCNTDSDDDGLPDDIDPFPTNPGGTVDFIEDMLRDLCAEINGYPTSEFVGPNNLAKKLKRAVLAQSACAAANFVKCGNYEAATALLEFLLKFVDDDPTPPDWMVNGAAQDQVKGETEFYLLLLSFF